MIDDNARIVVASLDGRERGPIIETGLKWGSLSVALSALAETVCVVEFSSGRVTAFNWRTGERRWRQTCSRKSGLIATFGQCAAVSSLDGPCCFLDLSSGRIVARLKGVSGISQSNDGPRMALQRRRLEIISSCTADIDMELPVQVEYPECWINPSSCVVAQSNGLLKCFELDRATEQWRYDCGEPGASVGSVCLYEARRVVFGVRSHSDQSCPPRAMLWDANSGAKLFEEPSPDGIVTLRGVRHGRFMLAGSWRFDVEKRRWEEWDFESLWPR
jgi:hypothetical protein